MKLTNSKFGLWPETTLYKEEVDVIVAVLQRAIEDSKKVSIRKGTFMLCGMKRNTHKLQRIISFDFGRGPVKNFSVYGKDSRSLAEEVIVTDAKGEHSPTYSAISCYIYLPNYLSLATTKGRFTCVFYAGDGDTNYMTHIYCAVAQTLALMGKEDKVLQSSCDTVFFNEIDAYPEIYTTRSYVEGLFEKCELPEIVAWKKWHDPANAFGGLPLFFE